MGPDVAHSAREETRTSTVAYTSDNHFGHSLIARLRGFGGGVDAYDREL